MERTRKRQLTTNLEDENSCSPKKAKYSVNLHDLEEAGRQRYSDLVFSSCEIDGGPVLICTTKKLYTHPPIGAVSRVKIIVKEDGRYDFQVSVYSKEQGLVSNKDEYLHILETISVRSKYKFCPGLHIETYKKNYYDVIRYHPKKVRITCHPISRIDSKNCLLWHLLAKNASILEKDMTDVMCKECKRLRSDLEQRTKKVTSLSPDEKENRLKPCSHFPEKYLSPKSVKQKRKNMQLERTKTKKLAHKHADMEVSLNGEQHIEMCQIMKKLSSDGVDDVEKSLVEGDASGIGESLRAIWRSDMENIQREFQEDQERNS